MNIHVLFQKFRKSIDNMNYFYKSLILVLIAMCLPIAILAVSSYYVGTSQIENEINRTQRLQLNQMMDNVNNQIQQLEITGTQWIFNPAFSRNLNNQFIRQDYHTAMDVMGSLRVLMESNPMIDNVFLYIRSNDSIISYDEGINTIDKEEDKIAFRDILKEKNSIYWWGEAISPLKYKNKVNTALVCKVVSDSNSSETYGAIIIYLNKEYIDGIINQLNPDGYGTALMLKTDYSYVTNGRKSGSELELLDEAIRKEVLNKNIEEKDSSFIFEGGKYSLFVRSISPNKLKLVIATPLSRLTAPVMNVSRLILGVSILGLALAFLLSIFVSSKIYKPIKHFVGILRNEIGAIEAIDEKNEIRLIEQNWKSLKEEKKALKIKLENSFGSLKESFFLQLVQGHLNFLSENELRERIKQYWGKLNNSEFTVLIIRLSGIKNSERGFNEGDEQLATFATANIVEEMIKSVYDEAAVINLHEMTVAVLLSFTSERSRESIKKELFYLSKNICDTLTNCLGLRVTIGMGKLVTGLRKIHEGFVEAKQALLFRDVVKEENILDIENLMPHGDGQVTYPFELENSIIQSVRIGMEDKAMEYFQEFSYKLKQAQGKELFFKQGMLQLLGSILKAVIKTGINTNALYQSSNLFDELGSITEPSEMMQWFQSKVIRPYILEMSKKRQDMMDTVVNNVIQILERDYSSMISLESCADEQGVTHYNLSKAFKDNKGVNFIDYLTNIRMKKAKELLTKTNLKINDIAVKVGYQPVYFAKIFRKMEGMTPVQYRGQRVNGDGFE